ncbi:MAG: acetyl-CoA carboxylase biotin carboxyl carrier protein subunit [Runella slithyformis]|nr:MAG: acetyl-CoA carboxylase biotin carboxyl carrier protein subunit [Runella slithyformis]TAE98261.1 MAG: acetyl-CoA carboxylase biotin carboxyl carrier protein subunit [Runella slithyformis]TAF28655.1 MAG: acetyl-CoA carboxylase biotin carboxyl carrier protein subunit [Runella slithyformis]TAF46662.1 MAG: acetyl-CoA carboxylase biotin carboxyl carrier protein subunit [Runella slithyformis]TAF82372.1 MAG: acetyl-CoA carboxylase biotin carboxyl carrier protein subunit [Runella slithyformis]
MLKVTVNEKQTFEVETASAGILIDNQAFEWDLIELGNRQFHVLQDGRSYNAEVLEANYAEKTFTIKLNGVVHEVAAKDRFDLLLEKMGMSNVAKNKVNHIKAPMPGLIWEIKIKPGDVVQAGDVVLVLVAMKMENALKSPGEGVVKTVKVQQGNTVDKNQILVEFE